jgi:hypothetical protein
MMLFFSRAGIVITRYSLSGGLGVILAILFVIYKWRFNAANPVEDKSGHYQFTKNQLVAFLLVLFLAIFIRTAYLETTVFPSSTDLGHHMYWAKYIAQTGTIPDYFKRDIVSVDGNYQLGAPEKISDIIIGEHLIFAAINLLSGLDFISYFPVLVLFLINILSLLALSILAFRMFDEGQNGKKAAILTLLFIGPIFAIAPPQAKFVSGGVIGNIIGNLLLPLTFYFYLRFLKEKEVWFLTLALIFSMGIFYTHHMTGLIFLLTLALFTPLYLIFNFKHFKEIISDWKKIIFSWPVMIFAAFAIIFVFSVYIPSYITNNAVTRVIGTINKQEHSGLTLTQIKDTVGEARIALGIVGIFLFFLLAKNIEKNSRLILFSWLFMVFLVAIEPNLIKINIPSSRVANYGSYPLAILSAFALLEIFSLLKTKVSSRAAVSQKFVLPAAILIFGYLFVSGLGDNAENLMIHPNNLKALDTFHASAFLASAISPDENVVTDHVYISADSWSKLFFMRDYNFPLYRANPDRYENQIDKTEMCTLLMITSPEDAKSKKCFDDLNIAYVMVNKTTDGPQFERTEDFSKIYSSNAINIYLKNF